MTSEFNRTPLYQRVAQLEERMARVETRLEQGTSNLDAPTTVERSGTVELEVAAIDPGDTSLGIAIDPCERVPVASEPVSAPVPPPPIESASVPVPPTSDAASSTPEPSSGAASRPGEKFPPLRFGSKPPTPPTAPAQPTIPEPTPKPRDGRSLEFLIGGTWMAWIGALVIVIGGGFLVKLGIDAGLWHALSPTMRCLFIATLGGGLVGLGAWMQKRVGPLAAVGLHGAGLGLLYLDAFAASRVFGLVSEPVAVVMMGFVVLLGVVITLKTNFRSIGVLSLIGGYLAPILLLSTGARDLTFLSYLTALFGIALTLSALRRRPFRPLRLVAMIGQIIVGGVWMLTRADDQWFLGIVFLSGWWSMVVIESLWNATRRQSAQGNVIMIVTATASYALCGIWILATVRPVNMSPWMVGLLPLSIGVIGAAIAMHFGPGLAVLRDRPRTALDKFALTMWVQFSILLLVAVGIMFDHIGQAVGWIAIALGAIELGRRLPSRGVAVFGFVTQIIAHVHLILLIGLSTSGFGTTALTVPLIDIPGALEINRLSIIAMLNIAAMFVVAFRTRQLGRVDHDANRAGLLVFASLCTMLLIGVVADGIVCTTLWIGASLGILALRRTSIGHWCFVSAGLASLLPLGDWFLVHQMDQRILAHTTLDEVTWILNAQSILGVLLAFLAWRLAQAARTSLKAISELPSSETWPNTFESLFRLMVPFILLVTATIELVHGIRLLQLPPARYDTIVASAVVSLWSLGSVVLGAFGRTRRDALRAASAWILSGVLAAAWLLFVVLIPRAEHRLGGSVIFNEQFISGLVALGAVLVMPVLLRGHRLMSMPLAHSLRNIGHGILIGMIFALGTMEIDRFFPFEPMARQAGWSIYWCLLGVSLVYVGFRNRLAIVRHVGLGLLGLTVCKVLLVDMSSVDQIWRIISFIVSGLLMVGTSVLYARGFTTQKDDRDVPEESYPDRAPHA